MQNMNWDDLRFFLAAARAKTLTGAARRLGVNQTTVARRLEALEGELGVKLFDRTPA
jgi:DNA-binding transcriptional LysR family regulator